ncbi:MULTISPECIES: hypothetical protein [Streptomyces]|nr:MULTISPECIES: hypothetical protein [Streptomyces]MCZ4100460.1 hypothetical protein [Streptomyces sp. H39-C1]
MRRRGEECAEGREVLPAGTLVIPAALGLAASVGCDTPPCTAGRASPCW